MMMASLVYADAGLCALISRVAFATEKNKYPPSLFFVLEFLEIIRAIITTFYV